MKIITGLALLTMLSISPALRAQEGTGPAEYPPGGEFRPGPGGEEGREEGRPPGPPRQRHNRKFGKKGMRGQGIREAGLRFKQFRQEVRDLGREIRENELMIRSLEEELETIEPGIPRAEVRKKLNECRLREAELQMELARKRVDFTRQARDLAQQRYDRARLGMERVKEKIKKNYPDLAARLEPEMPPPDNPGANPRF